jgi:hypothetical protein
MAVIIKHRRERNLGPRYDPTDELVRPCETVPFHSCHIKNVPPLLDEKGSPPIRQAACTCGASLQTTAAPLMAPCTRELSSREFDAAWGFDALAAIA